MSDKYKNAHEITEDHQMILLLFNCNCREDTRGHMLVQSKFLLKLQERNIFTVKRPASSGNIYLF
jgi:hypothetical protein